MRHAASIVALPLGVKCTARASESYSTSGAVRLCAYVCRLAAGKGYGASDLWQAARWQHRHQT
eukprot:scaffold4384_cov367-Prasinococcus_capsulatus_cf.AAC.7